MCLASFSMLAAEKSKKTAVCHIMSAGGLRQALSPESATSPLPSRCTRSALATGFGKEGGIVIRRVG